MRNLLSLAAMAAFLALAPAAMAQGNAPIDRAYEDGKAAEISAVKLQLATRPAALAIQELNEAENALRRLKEAKAADQRRKIAAELEMAITRLKIAANGASASGRD